jgi:hypothetical protein
MGVFLELTETELSAEPGETVSCDLDVRNTGAVVDQITLELIGDANKWGEITPKIINLFPGDETTAEVVFKPPKSSDVLAGDFPFAIRAVPREDPEGSMVEEGTVTVEPFIEITTEIIPHASRGAFRGRHKLAVDNRGNIPVPVEISLLDSKNDLEFKHRVPTRPLEPGTATLFPLRAIPKKRFLKGKQKTHAFKATVTGEDFDPVTADAAMVQDQILPTWLPKVLAGLLAMAVALTVLWFTVLKPVLKSEAQTAATQDTQSLNASVQSDSTEAAVADSAAAAANSKAQAANNQAGVANKVLQGLGEEAPTATDSPSAGSGSSASGQNSGASANSGTNGNSGTNRNSGSAGSSATPTPAGVPTSISIQSNAAAGHAGTYQTKSFAVPAGTAYLISDILLSNAAGDHGYVEISIDHASGSTTQILTLNLADFVSQEEHFVEPIPAQPGDQVVLGVDCTNTSTACSPLAYFSASAQAG